MNDWDTRLAAASGAEPAPLLQSFGYGEVQRHEGWDPERIELGPALATVLVSRGTAYVPRGPVPATEASLGALVEWARGRSLARLRVEPEAAPELASALRSLGFTKLAEGLQPAHTMIVPLAGEEEMLSAFKPKHRYNIRLAERKGVTVESGADVDELHRQTSGTAARQGITLPSAAHYRRRLELLPWCRVYVARHEGVPLAAIMVARFDGRAYYLFGGSSGELRNLQPTYLVQWVAMREAAAEGCTSYDLWGAPPGPDPDHPWAGLWQFKSGFGAPLTEFVGAWELVLDAPRAAVLAARDRARAALSRLLS